MIARKSTLLGLLSTFPPFTNTVGFGGYSFAPAEIRSRSITTEVSSKPRLGSAIDGLVYNGVDVGAKARGVNAGGVANLIVRNIDERVVQALKRRAARHNRIAEAEHRVLLEEALVKTRRKSLAEVLASMADVGRDEDFERRERTEARDVFD